MSDIATTYTDSDVLLLGDAQPVIGTAMLGEAFGTVKRAQIVRTGEPEEIKDDAGSLKLLLLKNPGFTLLLECCFDAEVTPPGLLEAIVLPYVGVTGRVMPGVTLLWEEGGERGLSIPVSQWDSMESASAYRLDPAGALHSIS